MSKSPAQTALVIERDEHVFTALKDQIASLGWSAQWAATNAQAIESLRSIKWPLIFFNRNLRDGPALPVEQQIETLQPAAHLILLTNQRNREVRESPVRDIYGVLVLCYTSITADVKKLSTLIPAVEERLAELQDAIVLPIDAHADSPIIGSSPMMVEARRRVAEVAGTAEPVLITGDEGTGKTLVAHAIHEMRGGADDSLILILCEEENERAAAGQTLRVAEVINNRERRTIYLTQLDQATSELQRALLALDVLVNTSVSVIASSIRNLGELVDLGRFSAELYSRLTNDIYLPPLRERREDIELLIPHFSKRLSNRPFVRISRSAWELIEKHDWPFNLPELHNTVINGLATGAGAICVMDLPFPLNKARRATR